MTVYDLTTARGCIGLIADRRFTCRRILRQLDELHGTMSTFSRAIRVLRESKNPMDLRRANVYEERRAKVGDGAKPLRDFLLKAGEDLYFYANMVDRYLPRDALLDLLNVNPVDRRDLRDDDGLIEVIFIHGLEDSAENRARDRHCGPLFQACHMRCMRELRTNKDLQQLADEKLFGPGGMFEFVPRATMQPDGTLVRLPPALRLADPNVDQAGRAPGGSDEAA